jgi:hypothetical protein
MPHPGDGGQLTAPDAIAESAIGQLRLEGATNAEGIRRLGER